MKVVIFGKNGQLAHELNRSIPDGVNAKCYSREECDIRDHEKVQQLLFNETPHLVINASAYTKVDLAETEKQEAFAVNAAAVGNLGNSCQQASCRLIHVSTDFVFDGEANQPYQPHSDTNPIGVYGASKLEGEKLLFAVEQLDFCIVRTAWVYSSHGNNFVKTMLHLMSTKDQLRVVENQIGSPTWAKGLAHFIWKLGSVDTNGALHKVTHWTDTGVASWFDFAVAIQDLALEKGLLNKRIPVIPIPDTEYPTPAKRPKYSVLQKDGFGSDMAQHWRSNLSTMLDELLS